jgi:uncharacterized protein (TIGR02147 family)
MSNPDDKPDCPQVLGYLDFREYLNDFWEWRKASDKRFSQRMFARQLGLPLSSSSLLPAILKGRRNLSPALRIKFAKALALNEKQSRYFDLLVQFNQAKDMAEKNHFFSQLSRFRQSRAHIIKDDQLDLFSRWHHTAVWHTLGMDHSQPHPGVLASRLFPPVTAGQVEEALALLMRLGLIRKMANGYAPTEKHVFTPPDVKAKAACEHIRELTRMSMEVMEQVPPENRQYNALMFSVSPEGFRTVKDRVRGFMEELRDIVDRDSEEDRIYTLTLQLFPNSRLPEPKPSAKPTTGHG